MAYPNPLVSANEVLQALADVLKRPLTDLTPTAADATGRYSRQAVLYAQQAYNELLIAYLPRGYTAAQVDSSDQGKAYNRDLAVWYMVRDEANLPDGVKLQWQAEYDWRAEWAAAPLTVGGVPVAGTNPLRHAKYRQFDTDADPVTRLTRL